MLPPALEKLILQNKASQHNFTQGMPGGIIRVPTTCTAIVYNIQVFPFVDAGEDIGSNTAWWGAVNHQMVMYSQEFYQQYVLRSSLLKNSQGTNPLFGIGDGTNIQMYQLSNSDIYLEWSKIPSVDTAGLVLNENTVPDTATLNPKRPPIGYGKGAGGVPAVVNWAQLNTETRAYKEVTPAGVSQVNYSEKFQFPIISANQIVAPTNEIDGIGNIQFPMMNVSYVIVKDKRALDSL